jgi:hypothetical protein
MTGKNQPQDRSADHAQDASRSSTWAVVTWMNAELRDRIQRNGAALADMHLAKDAQLPVRAADPELEDREAEP